MTRSAMERSNVKTRVIFFGTSEFAVAALGALFNAGPVRSMTNTPSYRTSNGVNYEIVAVITQPDKPAGRKQILTPPPVKVAAAKFNIDVWQPKNLKIENLNLIENWKLKIENCDLGVVAAYGKLIPPEIFNLPKHGTLNIHPSLLPKYRGPSPIQTAILNGDTETGVTIMKVDEEMDHGEIVSSIKYQVLATDNYEFLQNKLAQMGADLLIKTLPDYLSGRIKLVPQDHLKATFTKKITAADGEIRSDEIVERAYNKIRALNPEPGTFVWFEKNDKKLRLKILEADLEDSRLKLKRVQLEGGKPMAFKEFLAGHPNFRNDLVY